MKKQTRILVAFLLLISSSSLAYGQTTRTWVSGVGDDTNPCSRSQPCKTFQGALAKTLAGGEISALDAGGFGPITINQSVTINGDGTLAGTVAVGVDAVVVDTAVTDTVVLRGLEIEGAMTGLTGIRMIGGGTLHIENCTVSGFRSGAGLGIDVEPTLAGTSKLFIKDTIVRNNGSIPASTGGGILIKPGSTATVKASLDNVRLENNTFGIKMQDFSTVSISNSVSCGNGFSGITAVSVSGGAVAVNINHTTSANNGTFGILSQGANSAVRVGNVTIAGNQTGWSSVSSGQIISFGNNNVDGNAANGFPTLTLGNS
jgi:hypothetical protein